MKRILTNNFADKQQMITNFCDSHSCSFGRLRAKFINNKIRQISEIRR